MVDNGLHQPRRCAGAAQGRIGLNMGEDIAPVMFPVVGENDQIIFRRFETMPLLVVDHFLGSGDDHLLLTWSSVSSTRVTVTH